MARIGLRNLKTALAVFISMIVSKLLNLEFPFFVTIAAIISMENSLMNSFKAGRSRMVGTFIGAGIGLICALISPGSAVMCGIGMVVVIYLCNFLKWRSPIPIAGIVFMAIMVSLKGRNPVPYSVNHIFDTLIGILIAVVVNYLIFPPNYLPKICAYISDLVQKTEKIFYDIVNNKEDVDWAEYENEVAKANELLELICSDNKVRKRRNTESISKVQKVLAELNEIYRHLRVIAQLNPVSSLNPMISGELQTDFGWNNIKHQVNRENENDVVFNYHVRKVLDLYRDIKQRG